MVGREAHVLWLLASFSLFLFLSVVPAESSTVPSCRLDHSNVGAVEQAAKVAISGYKVLGEPLPIDRVVVNPANGHASESLAIVIVKDAHVDQVDEAGCLGGNQDSQELSAQDSMSVRGGCVVLAGQGHEIRCSSTAIEMFSESASEGGPANPTLLYVLAHELAHLAQGHQGEFIGKIHHLSLSGPIEQKWGNLRRACDPVLVDKEEQADAWALDVLKQSLNTSTYRESAFTDRGAMYWNIDRIRLAAHEWEQAQSRTLPDDGFHQAFSPESFPTPPEEIKQAAQQFVCDVATHTKGEMAYPARQSSHPAPEQRLRKVAEALEPLAQSLPGSSERTVFPAFAELQQSVSPIFTHIYRETGVYFDSLYSEICSIVNASDHPPSCPQSAE